MAIELLDLRKNWAKVRAAFRVGDLFRNPPKPKHHPFKDSLKYTADPTDAQQGTAAMKASPFTGQTYNNRK